MKEVLTRDGTVTLHSEEFDEWFHSLSGAKEEAVKKYVEPTKIAERAQKGNITILDFCFGLGYNTAAAIDCAREVNPDCKITVVGLEKNEEVLAKIRSLDAPFDCFDLIKEASEKNLVEKDGIRIKLLVGNAQETVKKLHYPFDVVFFDPFSPQKCPELWTTEIFREIRCVLKPGAVLATYSCAARVRRALKEAGFHVKDGPQVARRGPATLAFI